ncbi:hypothetical protein GF325_12780, partial [Candidatus Bathyarchaeota archaeon]|nr:hypothetical protein [Candidatus Bathyarchaeota archaeon]
MLHVIFYIEYLSIKNGERSMVVIAIPSDSDRGMEGYMDFRFGRCAFFTFVELDNDGKLLSVTTSSNPATQAMGGAGPMAVQFVTSKQANVAVVAQVGPNAAAALSASGMQVLTLPDMSNPPYTVKSLVEAYKQGELIEFAGANVVSKTGMG